jgi:hypothetical protein
MKVYLGPYPTEYLRARFFDRYMDKKYKYMWPDADDFTKWERFVEILEDSLNAFYRATINKVLRHRKRKIKVRIDKYDVWSADHTLALIILPTLKMIREYKHGCPFVDDVDAPEEIRSNKAPAHDEWDWDVNNTLRWEYVLNEMIYTFECDIDENWDDQFYSGEHDISWEKTEDGKFYQAKKGPNNTFKIDREAMDKAWERRKNGMRLFAKYYHSLWN